MQSAMEIDYNPDSFFKILKSASFKKYFKGLDDEGKLKTAPKGFDKDHPHLEILKNKHFLVSYPLPDKLFNEKNADAQIIAGFKAMHPFIGIFEGSYCLSETILKGLD